MTRLVWTLPDGQQTARWAEDAGGGPGGSQDLASVLAVGGDPESNPVTGPLLLRTDGDFIRCSPAGAATPILANIDSTGSLGARSAFIGNTGLLEVDEDGTFFHDGPAVGFFGTTAAAQPVVPLTLPTVQNVIDALVALGLVSQSD